jgi:hypothetical protein
MRLIAKPVLSWRFVVLIIKISNLNSRVHGNSGSRTVVTLFLAVLVLGSEDHGTLALWLT